MIHAHGHFGIWIYWYRAMLKKFSKGEDKQIVKKEVSKK